MPKTPVYLDNHSTTRVDPRVVEAMVPCFTEIFGNASSTSHVFGWDARDVVEDARERLAAAIGASSRELVFTSGATESNNLVIRGLSERQRQQGRHMVSVASEHKAMLDPLARLARRQWEITLLPVRPQSEPDAGCVDLDQLRDSLRDDTVLVSVMLANNEIGVIQPLEEIADICAERNVLLHTDATQAVGRIPVDVRQLGVHLLSFSAHKFYGPKGIGALYIRRRGGRVRLQPQIEGGGQEGSLRSGTLNVPGIIGFAKALDLCLESADEERSRIRELRNRLFERLTAEISGVTYNGPPLGDLRLPGNLNCRFPYVDGEALMMSMREVAVSSGSACTSTNPEPSHVLRALGLSDDESRASLRFGVGRFNTEAEVHFAAEQVAQAVGRLRKLSSMAD